MMQWYADYMDELKYISNQVMPTKYFHLILIVSKLVLNHELN